MVAMKELYRELELLVPEACWSWVRNYQNFQIRLNSYGNFRALNQPYVHTLYRFWLATQEGVNRELNVDVFKRFLSELCQSQALPGLWADWRHQYGSFWLE